MPDSGWKAVRESDVNGAAQPQNAETDLLHVEQGGSGKSQ
jgi:hypothetical protein